MSPTLPDAAGIRPLGMTADFLRWWRAGLALNLPPLVDAVLLGDRRVMTATIEEDSAVLRLRQSSGRISAETRIPPDGALPSHWRTRAKRIPVVFDVPETLVLTRRVDVPEAAARARESAVSYGLSRWTPFQHNDVYVTSRTAEVSGTRATIELKVVTRASVASLVDRLSALGVQVDALRLAPRDFALVPLDDRKRRRRNAAHVVDAALFATAVSLAVWLAAIGHGQMMETLERLRSTLNSEIALRREASALEADIQRMEARRSFLLERLADETRFSATDVVITRLLPSEVEIEEVTWTPVQTRLVLSAAPEVDAAVWSRLDVVRPTRVLGTSAGGRQLRELTLPSFRGSP